MSNLVREQSRRVRPEPDALARTRSRLSVVIATLIVPFETIAILLLFVVGRLPWIGLDPNGLEIQSGWMNSYQAQILPFVANGFSIFLWRS
jgi:multiple sugar transport system permease protein